MGTPTTFLANSHLTIVGAGEYLCSHQYALCLTRESMQVIIRSKIFNQREVFITQRSDLFPTLNITIIYSAVFY